MSDTGYPNVFRIGADGKVSADFSGHVHATGVDLDANPAVGTRTAAQSVQWSRTTDGSLLASHYAYGTTDARTGVLAQNADNSAQAILGVQARPPAGQLLRSQVWAMAETVLKTIIAADGSSDFLQLLGAGAPSQVRLAYGTQPVHINAGANQGTLNVDTGLGSAPIAFANARNNAPLLITAAKVLVAGADGVITLQAFTTSLQTVAAATDIYCDWIALG